MNFQLFILVLILTQGLLIQKYVVKAALGECNGTTLVVQLELFTTVKIQSPGFQAGQYTQNLSCAWRFDRSRNTSSILYTLHHKGMVTTPDVIQLYRGVDNTGTPLVETTGNLYPDYTLDGVVDHSSLFLLFTTDDDESNDGEGFEMYILESDDYSGTDCSITIQIQPQPTTQYLTSPYFPHWYPYNANCAWNITTAVEVIVSVIYMDVEKGILGTCFDYVTIGDSGDLCAAWEFNINKTYVFNDSFLITFYSGNIEERRGFVLSYVERKDNTTEEQTSTTTDVETTTPIELSTTQQSTSMTETTTDEISTAQYSTSTVHIFPVDGEWGEWGPWTCSVTCGTGIDIRTRICDNPAPAYDGNDCTGPSSETRACFLPPCRCGKQRRRRRH